MSGEWGFNFENEGIREIRQYDRGVLLTLTKIQGDSISKDLQFPVSKDLQSVLNNKESPVEFSKRSPKL